MTFVKPENLENVVRCLVPTCDRSERLKFGLCNRHYSRWVNNDRDDSVLLEDPPSSEEIFWSKVEIMPDGCWLWTGSKFPGKKYGQFKVDGKNWRVHRYSYKYIGEKQLNHNLTLDHLCREPLCVNPDHLEEVTASENYRRHPKEKVCKRGHVRVPGSRRCSACGLARYRERRALSK